MQIHTGTQKDDVSLAKEFQQFLTKNHSKNGDIDQGKSKKWFIGRKWTDRQYHVQDNADIEHKDVKMYCNTSQFPELSFFGPHSKTHSTRGLSKHYHLCFDPKLGMVICAIFRIPCDFVACTKILDKPWISGIP